MSKYDGSHEDILLPFVDAMRYKLSANRHKGKRWDENTLEQLFEKAKAELDELQEAIAGGNRTEILLESADLSNFAMFIASKALKQAAMGTGSIMTMADARNEYEPSPEERKAAQEFFGGVDVKGPNILIARDPDFTVGGEPVKGVELEDEVVGGIVMTGRAKVVEHESPDVVDRYEDHYIRHGHWCERAHGPVTLMWKHAVGQYIVYEDTHEARDKKLPIAPWTLSEDYKTRRFGKHVG